MNYLILVYETIWRFLTGRMIVHEIIHGLYQSSEFHRRDYQTLKKLNVDAIIDHAGDKDELMGLVKEEDYLFWKFFDRPELPDLDKLKEVAAWGLKKMREGRVLLTHCAAGHNRSGLTNGMILVLGGMRGKDAVTLIRNKVPGALSNKTFRRYLETL